MSDLHHDVGSDLIIGATGDLDLVSDDEAARERVLRRLLTTRGAYIWQLDYGGGLPGLVGSVVNTGLIQSMVRQQMLLEPAVARQPLPAVAVTAQPGGTVSLTIDYASAATGATQRSSIELGR
jgi:phage baseplate assembly protein W